MMEEPPTLSKYGRMRERYLREHRKAFYFTMKCNDFVGVLSEIPCNLNKKRRIKLYERA